ncbi:MAG: hypothetical protein MUF15_06475 [Acidobacteria bacterium]|nr:hypothetical protein [Acidobacteriota bacterium]
MQLRIQNSRVRIQNTRGRIQNTRGRIQNSRGRIHPFIKGVVTVTGTFFDFITVEIRSLYIPVLFAGGRILYFTGSICPRVGVDVKVRSLGAGASKLAAHKKPINLPIIIISSKKIIKKFLYTIKISKSKYMEK